MKRICAQLVMMMLFAISATGQMELSFNSSTVAAAGQDVDIDIVVSDGFDEIVSMQFSLNWDASVFEFESIENVTDVLPMFTEGNNIGTPLSAAAVSDGQLTVSWSQSSTQPASIPDDTRLFTLRLRSIGNVCDATSLETSNTPRIIEVVNNDFDILDLLTSGGDLSIDDGNCGNMNMDGVGLIIDDISAPSGGKLCIPIKATDFTDIESVQLGIEWDPTVLAYDADLGVNSVGISPVNVNATRVGQGELITLWVFDPEPVTLNDNDVLFEVCFDVIGGTGSSTDVSIVDFPNASPPFEIEISSNGTLDFFTDNATFTVGSGGARTGVGFIVDSLYTNDATSICVPIITENFDSLVAFMTGISFNSSVLTYTGFNNTGLSNVNVADQSAADGELRILWTDQNANPVTLSDGSSLLELCFDIIGTEGQTSPIGFINIPPNFTIEAIKFPASPTEFFIDDGVVIIGDEPVEVDAVELTARDVMFDLGETVCVDFVVGNFQDIAGMSFVLAWDESVIRYIEPRNPNLPGLGTGQANFVLVDNNSLRVLYTPTDPQSLADNTIIFQVCYEALAGCDSGASTEITIGSDSNISLEFINGDSQVLPVNVNSATIAAETCEMNNPQIELVTLTSPSCPGNMDGGIIVDLIDLTGSITCEWTNANGDVVTNNCNLAGQAAGNYTLTATDELEASVSETFVITDPSVVDTQSVSVIDCASANATDGEIEFSFTGGAGSYVITSTSAGIIDGLNISGLSAGEVTLVVEDAEGCEYMFSYTLNMCSGDEPDDRTDCNTVRSIISPNGDGVNELFIIGCLNDPDVASQINDLEVYNRWGELVYNQVNYSNNWNGTKSDGSQLDEGGYMWVFTIGSPTDRQIFRGTLTLLR